MNRQPRQLKIQGLDMQLDMAIMFLGLRVQGNCGSFLGVHIILKSYGAPIYGKLPYGPILA